MGWGRMLLFGNIGQQLDIEDATDDIASLKSALRRRSAVDRSQDEALAEAQKRVLDLELCVASLLRLLGQKGVLSGDELAQLARLVEADAEPGAAGSDPWESQAAAELLAGDDRPRGE